MMTTIAATIILHCICIAQDTTVFNCSPNVSIGRQVKDKCIIILEDEATYEVPNIC